MPKTHSEYEAENTDFAKANFAKTHAELSEKTDFEKLTKERSAAVLLRDDICFIIGSCQASNPEISAQLEKALASHDENRCQNWL
tara:strand:- start:974 stop:1228 length:255 start_codon:yes stop_codon:yes gene_type:complete